MNTVGICLILLLLGVFFFVAEDPEAASAIWMTVREKVAALFRRKP